MQDGTNAINALSWSTVQHIVGKFEALNPYDKKIVPGSILRIEDINFDSSGNQRQLYGYGISAKRYSLYVRSGSHVRLVKVSEHGLGLYYRPKEGFDSACDVALWIKEGWQWLLHSALGLPCTKPRWFDIPVMRRIAISTPNVMAALRRLNRDQARPYNFAISPVVVNLSESPVTLLGPFEKDPARWVEMSYINIYDGSMHKLNDETLLALPQTFEMVFAQYSRHPEYKSLAPNGTPCRAETRGLLRRYPVNTSGFHVIGKETERGWEHSDDVSTLLPTLVLYREKSVASEKLRQRLRQVPLTFLERETGLSRHTIVRARRGERVHHKSTMLLRAVALKVQLRSNKSQVLSKQEQS